MIFSSVGPLLAPAFGKGGGAADLWPAARGGGAGGAETICVWAICVWGGAGGGVGAAGAGGFAPRRPMPGGGGTAGLPGTGAPLLAGGGGGTAGLGGGDGGVDCTLLINP